VLLYLTCQCSLFISLLRTNRFFKNQPEQNRTEQNRTEQNRTEQNRMSLPKDAPYNGGALSSREKMIAEFADAVPKHVDSVKMFGPNEVKNAWNVIYGKYGIGAGSEKEKLRIRGGVYMYAFLNGTSRAGGWSGSFVTSDGRSYDAGVVTRAVGNSEVRRFMRGNGEESYNFLKHSGAVTANENSLAQAATFGFAPSLAFCFADWLDGNAMMSLEEQGVVNKIKAHNLERSRRARGGLTLEQVEDGARHASLAVQGPLDAGVAASAAHGGETVSW